MLYIAFDMSPSQVMNARIKCSIDPLYFKVSLNNFLPRNLTIKDILFFHVLNLCGSCKVFFRLVIAQLHFLRKSYSFPPFLYWIILTIKHCFKSTLESVTDPPWLRDLSFTLNSWTGKRNYRYLAHYFSSSAYCIDNLSPQKFFFSRVSSIFLQ